MVRNCITCLTAGSGINNPLVTSQPLTTKLFFFLYHLASYQAGSEALVSCGMMESLLKVIQWPSAKSEHITFVTSLTPASTFSSRGWSTYYKQISKHMDPILL